METEYYLRKKKEVAEVIAKSFEGNLTCEQIAERILYTLNLQPWEKHHEPSRSYSYQVPSQGR
jgi:hypothetical protein